MVRKKDKLSALDTLSKNLYAKNVNVKDYERKRFLRKKERIAEDWGVEGSANLDERKSGVTREPRKKMTTFTKFFIASLIFLCVSFAAAAAIYITGQNSLSFDNVSISVLGPNSVAGGEVLSFDVIVTNQNPSILEQTDLIVNYPRGSFAPEGDAVSIAKDIVAIEGGMQPGTRETKKFQAVLFGEAGETKEIRISFEYRAPGSNSLFYKERIYQIKMESSPVEIRSENVETIVSGDEVELLVEAVSNSNKTVSNLLLEIEYPFGFSYASSSIPAVSGDNLFTIGILEPGEKRQIQIKGILAGQDEEARNFRYVLGVGSADRSEITQVFASSESQVVIEKPPIRLATTVDGKNDSIVITQAGENVKVDLTYTNNLSSAIENPVISAKLSGAYSSRAVISTEGFYNSNNAEILWKKNDTSALSQVLPAETDTVSFTFRLPQNETLAGSFTNPETQIFLSMTGTAFDQDGASRQVSSSISRKVKIESELDFKSGVFHSMGPFTNQGTLQPEVGKVSSYTVLWRLENTVNDVNDILVETTLPNYVEYLGINEASATSTLSYDPRARTLKWLIPKLEAGSGYSVDPLEVFFQVEMVPSLSQEGDTPILVNKKTISGIDEFTNTRITISGNEESTNDLDRDPAFTSGDGVVR